MASDGVFDKDVLEMTLALFNKFDEHDTNTGFKHNQLTLPTLFRMAELAARLSDITAHWIPRRHDQSVVAQRVRQETPK